MGDKRVVRAQVWYEDGPRESLDYSDIPDDGVLLVLVHYADGTRQIQQGDDFYFTAEGPADRIYGHTSNPADVDPDRYKNLRVLRGRWTDAITLERVTGEAMG